MVGLLLAALAPALAADLLPPGTPVRVTDVGRKDAFWRYRKEINGLRCRVDDPGLFPNRGRWVSGPVTCEDGQTYYFYQVHVERLPPATVLALPSPTPSPEPDAPRDAPRDAPPTLAAANAPATPLSAWPPGTRVRLDELSTADSHYPNRKQLQGRVCVVTEAPLVAAEGGWLSGDVHCEEGGPLFFFEARMSRIGPLAAPTAWPAGATVTVRDVAPGDAHFARRGEVTGHVCAVVEDALAPTGTGWWAGRLYCDDGRAWQFFKVAVEAASPPPVATP